MSLKIPATHWLHAISFESLGIESGDLVFVLAFQSLPLQLERRRDQVVLGNPRFRFHEYFAGNFELLNVGWKKKHCCYNRALTQHQVLNFQNCLIILKLRWSVLTCLGGTLHGLDEKSFHFLALAQLFPVVRVAFAENLSHGLLVWNDESQAERLRADN